MRRGKKPPSHSPVQGETPKPNPPGEVPRFPARGQPPKPNPVELPTWSRLDPSQPELILSQLHSWALFILTAQDLNNTDRAIVKQTLQQIRSAHPELLGLLSRINDLALARRLLELIGIIADAAYVVGAHGPMPDTARVFFEKSRAVQMRFRRATSDEEQELQAAIKSAIDASKGKIPSGKPYKDAESIIDSVNARVRKPVKVDTIARRLAALSKK